MSKFVGLIVGEAQDSADAPKKERKKKTGANKSASQSNKAETVKTPPADHEKIEVDSEKTVVDPDAETDKVEVKDNDGEMPENTGNEGDAQDSADAPKKERK